MAEQPEDPREVSWHPRLATVILGRTEAEQRFKETFASGNLHHAWLMTGPSGIGKATLAYRFAQYVLSAGASLDQTQRWIASRAHPDLCVLERGFTDGKPQKLRTEISVDQAREFIRFFNRTSGSGGWRVGLVDCADDLNVEAANALLKLVEEPPVKTLILLVCHTPGRILRTLRSRCMRLPLGVLSLSDCTAVLQALPLEPKAAKAALTQAAALSGGRPGHALQLLNNDGAKAFDAFMNLKRRDAGALVGIGQRFSGRAAGTQDYEVFMSLLLDWLAGQAASLHGEGRAKELAQIYAKLMQEAAIVNGYNLDRRSAVIQALTRIEDALKAA